MITQTSTIYQSERSLDEIPPPKTATWVEKKVETTSCPTSLPTPTDHNHESRPPSATSFDGASITIAKPPGPCATEIRSTFPLPSIKPDSADSLSSSATTLEPHFWFSNDYSAHSDVSHPIDYSLFLKTLKDAAPENSEKPGAAILVGGSSLLASLTSIARHAKLVLLVDNDHLLLHAQMERLKLFKQCKSINDEEIFKERLLSFVAPQDKINSRADLAASYDTNKAYLGSFHAFDSEQSFAETQAVLDELEIVPVCLNLFQRAPVNTLGRILHDHEFYVRVLNTTNVFDYPEYFYQQPDQQQDSYQQHWYPPTKFIEDLPMSDQAWCHATSHFINPGQGWQEHPEAFWKKTRQKSCEMTMAYTLGKAGIQYDWLYAFNACLNQLLNTSDENHETYESSLKLLLSCATPENLKTLKKHKEAFYQMIQSSSNKLSTEKKRNYSAWIRTSAQPRAHRERCLLL